MPEFTSISRAVAQQMLESFRLSLEHLVFRRVVSVSAQENDLQSICYYSNSDNFSFITLNEFKNGNCTKNQLEKIEFRYRKFTVGTSLCSLRNDSYNGIQIFCLSEDYAEIDLENLQFVKKSCTILPRTGDLVCILMNPSSDSVASWFTCSEQFMRMWTVLMFAKHPSFEARGREPRMRERLMSGNRLNTNSFLKWKLAHEQSDIQIDQTASDRFVCMRTEKTSKKWIHVYSALVLMIRYGELPTTENIPNNRDGGPHLKMWHLPSDFATKFIQKHVNIED